MEPLLSTAVARLRTFAGASRHEHPCTRLLPPDNGAWAANLPAIPGLPLEERAEAGRPLTLEISLLLESEP
jgi:hypothetical protein